MVTNDGGPGTSSQGATPSSPPQESLYEGVAEKAALENVIRGLRKRVPKLQGVLRDGLKLVDVVQTTLDIVNKVAGGGPWPAKLAFQAVIFLADNLLQVFQNATDSAAVKTTLDELKQKIQRLVHVQVPDEHEGEVEKIFMKLMVAAATIHELLDRSALVSLAS